MNTVLLLTLVFFLPALLKCTTYRNDKEIPFLGILLVSFISAGISYGFAAEYVIAYGNLYIFAWVAITCIACTISRLIIDVSKFFAKILRQL